MNDASETTTAQEPTAEAPRISPEPSVAKLEVDWTASLGALRTEAQEGAAKARAAVEEAEALTEEVREHTRQARLASNEAAGRLEEMKAQEPTLLGVVLNGAAWAATVFAVGAGLSWLADKVEARTAPGLRRVDEEPVHTTHRPPAETAQ